MSFNKNKNLKVVRFPYSVIGSAGLRAVATLFNASGTDKPGSPYSYTFTNTTGKTIEYELQWIVNSLCYSNVGSGAPNPFLPVDNVHVEYLNFPQFIAGSSSAGLSIQSTITNGNSVFSRNGFTPASLAGTHTAVYLTGAHKVRLKPGEFINFLFYLRIRIFEVNGNTAGGITRSVYEQVFKQETLTYLD